MSWEEIAISIAKDALTECDSDDEAIDYISERVKAEEIDIELAYKTVAKARINDPGAFRIVSDILMATHGYRINMGGTIDDVIFRLAFLIIYKKAFEKYCAKKGLNVEAVHFPEIKWEVNK